MLEISLTLALDIIFVALAFLYTRWFRANARCIASVTLSSAVVRTAILAVLIFWIYPTYSERMVADADLYYQIAVDDTHALLEGRWYAIPTQLGTEMMGVVGAALYLPTRLPAEGLYAVSTALSLVAATLFWAAVSNWRGVAAARGFLVGVMFWPSLLFWTGTYGKDCIAYLGMSLVTHAYSRMCRSRRWLAIFPELSSGFVLVGLIRPHFAFVAAVAICAAESYCVLTSGKGRRRRRALGAMAVMIAVGVLCWTATSAVTGAAGGTGDTPQDRLLRSSRYTAIGDSAIERKETNSVLDLMLDLPSSAVRVLLRPWPWEAHNDFALLASLESAAMLGLALWKWRSLLRNARSGLRSPFGWFCLTLALLLLVFSSTASNLGIIARSRAHVIPFLLALVSSGLPSVIPARRPRPAVVSMPSLSREGVPA